MSNSSAVQVTRPSKTASAKGTRRFRIPFTPEARAVGLARQRILRHLPPAADIALFAGLIDDYGETVKAEMGVAQGFYSVRDLRERYEVQRKTVERLPIPRHRFGGIIRFKREDVLAYEQSCRIEVPDHAKE